MTLSPVAAYHSQEQRWHHANESQGDSNVARVAILALAESGSIKMLLATFGFSQLESVYTMLTLNWVISAPNVLQFYLISFAAYSV